MKRALILIILGVDDGSEFYEILRRSDVSFSAGVVQWGAAGTVPFIQHLYQTLFTVVLQNKY